MQTSAHLRFGSTLRAVSSGALPPADGVPVRCAASDQEVRPAFLCRGFARSAAKRSPGAFPGSCLTPSRPSLARLGSRSSPSACLMGTCPGGGAVPRGHQPDRVCRVALVRQTAAPFRHSACYPSVVRHAGGGTAKRRSGYLTDTRFPAPPGLTSLRHGARRSDREGRDALLCGGAVCVFPSLWR